MSSAALNFNTPSGPLDPNTPGLVAWFTLDRDPDDAKVLYGFNMSPSYGPGRARAEFPSCVTPGAPTASGNIYVLPPAGFKVKSAPSRAYVGQPEWGNVELEPSVPPFPSRLDAISVKVPFQGVYVNSHAFGATYQATYGGNGQIPYYAAALQDFWAAGDGIQVLDQLKDWPFVMLYCRPGGPGYNEDGQPYGDDQIIPAFDCWGNMDVYKQIADTIIERGQKPCYILWGEGQEGYQWIKDNLVSWVEQMREGYDRLRFGPVIVGFDGVWPGSWSVVQMKEMIPRMRSVLGPDAYLGFFFAADYLWVENDQDYTKDWMDGLDIVFTSNGPDSAECPSLANKAGYMVPDPNFSTCQPDQGTHFVLHDNSRGPRVWLEGEWATYQTVRDPDQTWKVPVEAARAQMKILGCKGWG